jgi:hypothetical protein
MKRIKLACVMMAVLAGIAPAQENSFAVIRDLSGTVEIKTPLSGEWVPAKAGDRLEKESSISTGFRSTAVLVLGNSTLTVRPLTRLSLEELSRTGGTEQTELYLRSGRIRGEVSPPPGGKVNFTVRAPSATASVRGTSFEFDALKLRVDSGTVGFSGIGQKQTVNVAAGESSRVEGGKAVSAFSSANEEMAPPPPSGTESGVKTGETIPIIPAVEGGYFGGKVRWE